MSMIKHNGAVSLLSQGNRPRVAMPSNSPGDMQMTGRTLPLRVINNFSVMSLRDNLYVTDGE
jgi:hypothetical protein